MKWITLILLNLLMGSCYNSGHNKIGQYVYLEHNSKLGCVIAHTDKDCGRSTKTLCYAHELFQTANYTSGQWTFRYRGNWGIPLSFCAKCVSENQMESISDSIYARRERLDSEYIQQLIDELQEIKAQFLQQEAEMQDLENLLLNSEQSHIKSS